MESFVPRRSHHADSFAPADGDSDGAVEQQQETTRAPARKRARTDSAPRMASMLSRLSGIRLRPQHTNVGVKPHIVAGGGELRANDVHAVANTAPATGQQHKGRPPQQLPQSHSASTVGNSRVQGSLLAVELDALPCDTSIKTSVRVDAHGLNLAALRPPAQVAGVESPNDVGVAARHGCERKSRLDALRQLVEANKEDSTMERDVLHAARCALMSCMPVWMFPADTLPQPFLNTQGKALDAAATKAMSSAARMGTNRRASTTGLREGRRQHSRVSALSSSSSSSSAASAARTAASAAVQTSKPPRARMGGLVVVRSKSEKQRARDRERQLREQTTRGIPKIHSLAPLMLCVAPPHADASGAGQGSLSAFWVRRRSDWQEALWSLLSNIAHERGTTSFYVRATDYTVCITRRTDCRTPSATRGVLLGCLSTSSRSVTKELRKLGVAFVPAISAKVAAVEAAATCRANEPQDLAPHDAPSGTPLVFIGEDAVRGLVDFLTQKVTSIGGASTREDVPMLLSQAPFRHAACKSLRLSQLRTVTRASRSVVGAGRAAPTLDDGGLRQEEELEDEADAEADTEVEAEMEARAGVGTDTRDAQLEWNSGRVGGVSQPSANPRRREVGAATRLATGDRQLWRVAGWVLPEALRGVVDILRLLTRAALKRHHTRHAMRLLPSTAAWLRVQVELDDLSIPCAYLPLVDVRDTRPDRLCWISSKRDQQRFSTTERPALGLVSAVDFISGPASDGGTTTDCATGGGSGRASSSGRIQLRVERVWR